MKNLPSTLILLVIVPFLSVISCNPIDEEKYFEAGVSKLPATCRSTVTMIIYTPFLFQTVPQQPSPALTSPISKPVLRSSLKCLPEIIFAGRFSSVYWDYLSGAERTFFAPGAEKMVWQKVVQTTDPSIQRTWFSLFRSIAITETGLMNLGKTWESGLLPGGLKLNEDELCMLALTLAMNGHSDTDEIITRQRERITSNDRLMRFDFVVPSVSPDHAVRDAFFDSLRDPVNREHEPWVLEALGYLHHPMVAARSEKYLLPSLEMLEEIKKTGDIFFPGSWITTTLTGHHSAEARAVVEKFPDEHPDYPPDLRMKILQAADNLLRRQ